MRSSQAILLRSSRTILASSSSNNPFAASPLPITNDKPSPPNSTSTSSNTTNATSPLANLADSLLPPLTLYRSLLRAHRSLPADMRSLGDSYVRDEFKRHQKIDNPLQIVAFHSQWQMYLEQLKGGKDGISIRGKSLEPEMFDKLSEEQLYQLHEFMMAAREAYDPEKAQGQPPGTIPPPAPTPQKSE